ncbi:hypothetical protein [Streptomyces sp. NPDC101393]|uniref:hypothetical protein n=1 Tax=Streptomyces sp. NPDC101393 TaxID=3366141 RepID=UPI003801A142
MPYGAQQQPGTYGWGGPGMPPPPKKNTGKIWGIIGAIVAVLVIGTVAAAAFSAGGSPKVSAGPKYRITVPRSLVDGNYTLAKDISQMAESQIPHDGANAHDIHSAGGQYTEGLKSLTMLGGYGTIDDPDESVDHMIDGMTGSPSAELAVPEKKFLPVGGPDELTCGVVVKSEAGQKITAPFCAWADSSTTLIVTEVDGAHPDQDPNSIDLQEFANTAEKVRAESRKPLT